MGKIAFDFAELKKLVADLGTKAAENLVTPPELITSVEKWRSYSKDTSAALRQSDIDTTFDTITNFLVSLDLPEECYSAFKTDGSLRVNIQSHVAEDLIPLFMQQLLCYISLLSQLSDDKQQTNLMKFPPHEAIEYNCLLGTMERLNAVLQELQLQLLRPEEQALLAAHYTVIEAGRRLCATEFFQGNQPHVASAIEYLAGFEDPDKMGLALSHEIRASTAWVIYRDYVSQVNAELELTREERIEQVRALVTAEKPQHLQLMHLAEELKFNLADLCLDATDAENISYDLTKIPELFPDIELSSAVRVSFGLLDEDASLQIAELICSGDLNKQTVGVKALRLLGHLEQCAGSDTQFFRTFHEIGLLQHQSRSDALSVGVDFFEALQEKPLLSNDVNILMARISENLNMPEKILLDEYLAYLRDDDTLPSLVLLIKGVAPLALITKKLAIIEPDQLLEFLENAKTCTSFCFFRPDAEILLSSIIMCARMVLSPEDYAPYEPQIVGMGIHLTYLAACHYAPKVIECVENNFYPVQPADPKSYKLGLSLVKRGLFSLPAPYSLQTGAAVLAAHDVPFLIKKLRLIFTLLDMEPVKCLQTCSPNAHPLICTLISEGNLYALQQVFALLTPQQQKALILTEVGQRNMPIAQAIMEGQLSILNYFLALKQDNNTPLILLKEDVIITLRLLLKAVGHDQVEAVKALVSAGADITLPYRGSSWLHVASRYGCLGVIKYLAHLKKDGNYLLGINGRDHNNYTPLMQAVYYGKKAAMTALLDLGADATLTINGCSLLHMAVKFKQLELISFILSLKGPDGTRLIDINQRDDKGSTALLRSFNLDGVAAAYALIAAGADITARTASGISVLHIAAECGHLELLSYILNCKQEDGTYSVHIDHQSQEGWTAIMWAVSGGHKHIFTTLIAAGANLKLTTMKGESLLHIAGNSGQADFIRLILDCKEPDGSPTIDVNVEDGGGFTALMRAVYYQQKASIISLIAAGAKLHTKSNGSLLHMAVNYGHVELIPFLRDLKYSDGSALVDINQQDINGRTALMHAVLLENFVAVEALIAAGANFAPVGHDLFIDKMNPMVAAALLNVISSAQALQMLLFKNKEGLSTIQRFVAIVKDGDSETLLKAILSKLQKEERITLITTLSNEEKNLLFYANPKARTLLCEGFSEAELAVLDPSPVSQHSEEPAFKRRKIESIGSGDSTSFGNAASHAQALSAGLCLLSPPSASGAIANTASSIDPNKMDEAGDPSHAIGSKRKHPEDDLPSPGM